MEQNQFQAYPQGWFNGAFLWEVRDTTTGERVAEKLPMLDAWNLSSEKNEEARAHA